MAEGKHTPGTWDASAYEDGGFVILTPEGDVIASRNSWSHRAAESKANARLISAAPDLLDALKGSLASFKCTQNPEHYPADHWCHKATAAIAKVEGRL